MSGIKLGQYEHYKGKRYEVIGVARDSETLKDMVIYRALYDSEEFGSDALWVRPKEIFFGKVVIDGEEAPRFRLIV